MNQEQLNAIKERVAKASHGPWMVIENEFVHSVSSVIAAVSKIGDVYFITHAREDVPTLIAEVEYLREMLRDTRKIVRHKVREVKTLQNACKKHKAKQEALEFQLKVSIMHAEELDEELEAEEEEKERFREALSLYADEKRWVEPCTYTALVNGEPETVKDAPWAILDCGAYARQALGGEADE